MLECLAYCAICGGPCVSDDIEDEEWLLEPPTAVLIRENSVFSDNACNSKSNLQAEDLDLSLLCDERGFATPSSQSADHFFLIHQACERIAATYITFASDRIRLQGSCVTDDALIRSNVDFYLALETQLEIDRHQREYPYSHLRPEFQLGWSNGFYGAAAFHKSRMIQLPTIFDTGEPEQEPLDVSINRGWKHTPESKIFEADPEFFELDEAADHIWSFLRPKPSTADTRAYPADMDTFRHWINQKLPREVQNIIIEYLQPLGEKVPLQPIGVFLPEDWRRLLHSATPWLWDIELSNSSHRPPTREYDWEGFVRMLAQADAFEPGGCMQGAPLGLRNRRRIWRILTEMKAPRGEWRT